VHERSGTGTCPVCTAKRVLTPDFLIDREAAHLGHDLRVSVEDDLATAQMKVRSLFSMVAATTDPLDIADGLMSNNKAKKKGEFAQRKLQRLRRWTDAVEAHHSQDADRQAFMAFANGLPDLVCQPVSSYLEMQRYVWSFMSLMGVVTISLGSGESVSLSPSMYYSTDIRKALWELAYGWGQ